MKLAAWIGRGWAAREAIRRGTFALIESAVVLAVFVWTGTGLVAYGRETGWSMRGLLTLLDERWRGVLILGFVLFAGSVRSLVGRLASFKIGDNEVKLLEGRPMSPASDPETIES